MIMTILSKFQQEYTRNILGYSAMGMILSTCLGSIAIMSTLAHGNGFFQMLLVMITVILCSGHNATILTVQRPIVIFRWLEISTVINVLIIIGTLLF